MAEGKTMDGVLYRLGYAAQRIRSAADEIREAAGEAGTRLAEAAEGEKGDDSPLLSPATAGLAAAGLLSTRLFHPREVHWPRAVLAGIIGTLLYDAGSELQTRVRERKIGTSREAPADGEERMERVMARAGRYAAGVGMSAFYARHLYGRLPGSPLAQGVAFGVLDALALRWGGALEVLQRIAPDLPLPSAYPSLAGDDTPLSQHLLAQVAFGAGVGLVYRPKE